MMNYNKAKLRTLKNNYFMARSLYETIQKQSEEIQEKILVENEFYATDDMMEITIRRGGTDADRRILKPFDSYKMSDDNFQKYLNLCYEEYKRAGIEDKRGKEYCPEAEAHELYWEAEKQLVLYGIDLIPDGMKEKETLREAIKNSKYKEKVLDLILRLEC